MGQLALSGRGRVNSPDSCYWGQRSHTDEGWGGLSKVGGTSSPVGVGPTLLVQCTELSRVSYPRVSEGQGHLNMALDFNTHGINLLDSNLKISLYPQNVYNI